MPLNRSDECGMPTGTVSQELSSTTNDPEKASMMNNGNSLWRPTSEAPGKESACGLERRQGG
jgi:hypothetical protein